MLYSTIISYAVGYLSYETIINTTSSLGADPNESEMEDFMANMSSKDTLEFLLILLAVIANPIGFQAGVEMASNESFF